ncbi:MAG: glucose-6-phosphate isomerase [Candidatus Omnitrophota bacterium]
MNVRLLKMVSGFIVFIFVVTNLNPMGYASMPKAEVSLVPFKTLEIPAEFGQVTDTIVGDPTAPALIHIQSAHGNYEAEKNIEKLLGYIEQNSKVRLMLLEGAANKLQPELFRMFPDHPDFNRKVTDKLMQEGYLTGPENFLINHNSATRNGQRATEKKGSLNVERSALSGFEAFGVENLDSYKKDREAFIAVVKADKAAQASLRELRSVLERRFTTKLNKNLLALVRQETALDSGTLSFEGWLKVLAQASKEHLKLDLADAFHQNEYPFLVRYERLQAIGSKIDHEKAHQEAEAFIKVLEKRGISADVVSSFKVLLRESRVPSPESRAAGEYSPLRRAFDLAFEKLPKDFSMKSWPSWTLYAQHIILMQELEGKGLHTETLRLQERIQDTLAQIPDEKAYLAQARQLRLLRKLFQLELTRGEYEELNLAQRTTVNAQRENPKKDVALCALSVEPKIQGVFKQAMNFYSTAVVREKHMFTNALQKMGELKENRAVIVTGGFHTDGLKKLAAAKNCSYLQITPRITEVTKRDHEVYLRSILGAREFETSQMSAVLGSDPTAMETVFSRSEVRNFLAKVGDVITGLILTQPAMIRDALSLAFSGSALKKLNVVPSAPTRGPVDREAALEQQRRRESAMAATRNVLRPKDHTIIPATHGPNTKQSHSSQKVRNAKAGRSEARSFEITNDRGYRTTVSVGRNGELVDRRGNKVTPQRDRSGHIIDGNRSSIAPIDSRLDNANSGTRNGRSEVRDTDSQRKKTFEREQARIRRAEAITKNVPKTRDHAIIPALHGPNTKAHQPSQKDRNAKASRSEARTVQPEKVLIDLEKGVMSRPEALEALQAFFREFYSGNSAAEMNQLGEAVLRRFERLGKSAGAKIDKAIELVDRVRDLIWDVDSVSSSYSRSLSYAIEQIRLAEFDKAIPTIRSVSAFLATKVRTDHLPPDLQQAIDILSSLQVAGRSEARQAITEPWKIRVGGLLISDPTITEEEGRKQLGALQAVLDRVNETAIANPEAMKALRAEIAKFHSTVRTVQAAALRGAKGMFTMGAMAPDAVVEGILDAQIGLLSSSDARKRSEMRGGAITFDFSQQDGAEKLVGFLRALFQVENSEKQLVFGPNVGFDDGIRERIKISNSGQELILEQRRYGLPVPLPGVEANQIKMVKLTVREDQTIVETFQQAHDAQPQVLDRKIFPSIGLKTLRTFRWEVMKPGYPPMVLSFEGQGASGIEAYLVGLRAAHDFRFNVVFSNARQGIVRSEIRNTDSQRQQANQKEQVARERAKAATKNVQRTKDHKKITALHGPNTKRPHPSQKVRNAKAGRSETRSWLPAVAGGIALSVTGFVAFRAWQTHQKLGRFPQAVKRINELLIQYAQENVGVLPTTVGSQGGTYLSKGPSIRVDWRSVPEDKLTFIEMALEQGEDPGIQFVSQGEEVAIDWQMTTRTPASARKYPAFGADRGTTTQESFTWTGSIEFAAYRSEIRNVSLNLDLAMEELERLNEKKEQTGDQESSLQQFPGRPTVRVSASHLEWGVVSIPDAVQRFALKEVLSETIHEHQLPQDLEVPSAVVAKFPDKPWQLVGFLLKRRNHEDRVFFHLGLQSEQLSAFQMVLRRNNGTNGILRPIRISATAQMQPNGTGVQVSFHRSEARTAAEQVTAIQKYLAGLIDQEYLKAHQSELESHGIRVSANGVVLPAGKSVSVFSTIDNATGTVLALRGHEQLFGAQTNITTNLVFWTDYYALLRDSFHETSLEAYRNSAVPVVLEWRPFGQPETQTVTGIIAMVSQRKVYLGSMQGIAPQFLEEGGIPVASLVSVKEAIARSEVRMVKMQEMPALSGSVSELLQNFSDIVRVNENGVEILQGLKGNRRLFDLTRELTDNPNADVNHAAYWIASAITNARGVEMMSAASLYREKANLDKVWVIPATNMRAGGIIQLISFFESLDRLNAGGIAELAASEKGYSGLKTNEMFLAAAQIAHAFVGSKVPIIAQADHRQLKLDDIFGLDKTKIPAGEDPETFAKKFKAMTLDEREPYVDLAKRKKAFDKFEAEIRDMITARGYHIDLDPSTAVDTILLSKLYAESVTPDNPTGLSKLMNEVRKRLEAGETLESIGHWIDDMPEPELWNWVDQGRIERYREIHKHTIAATVDQIVKIRAHDEELKSKGLMARGTVTLIGGEERHIDDEVLADKPSEVEGTLAFIAGVKEGLAVRNAAFKAKYGVDIAGLDKISYQTGTAHGVAGRRVNTIVFRIHEKLLKVQGVQHGASKLTDDQFPILQKHRVGEVHLATQLQNIVLEAVAQKDPAMADVMWDLLVLFMKPVEESLTPVLKDYAAALKIEPKDLLAYAVGIQSNTVKFGQPEKDKKTGAMLPPKWDRFIQVVNAERGLDVNKTEDRRRVLLMMVSDSNDVPGEARSKLKDLVKYLCAPLLPYLTRMPEATEKEVIERLNDWQVKVYGLLGAKDSRRYFQQYALGHVAPLPAMPQALATAIQPARSEARAEARPIKIFAQHFSLKTGAATGSVNYEHLQEVGVTASLTGHSERRHRMVEVYGTDKSSPAFGQLLRTYEQFGDTDEVINEKLQWAAKGAAPVQLLCVGEPRSVRDAGNHILFVLRQLGEALHGMSQEDVAKAVSMIAYEPIWAINTGLNATPAEAQEVHQAIRNWLARTYSPELAAHMRILYGGSAKPDNVGGLSIQPDIDGFLVGGASLKLESFSKMGRIISATGDKGNGRTLVLAANWKAEPSAKRDNLDPFITGLAGEEFVRQSQVEIIVAPPHTLLQEAVSMANAANTAMVARSEVRSSLFTEGTIAASVATKFMSSKAIGQRLDQLGIRSLPSIVFRMHQGIPGDLEIYSARVNRSYPFSGVTHIDFDNGKIYVRQERQPAAHEEQVQPVNLKINLASQDQSHFVGYIVADKDLPPSVRKYFGLSRPGLGNILRTILEKFLLGRGVLWVLDRLTGRVRVVKLDMPARKGVFRNVRTTVQGLTIEATGSFSKDNGFEVRFSGEKVTELPRTWLTKNVPHNVSGTDLQVTLTEGKPFESITLQVEKRSEVRAETMSIYGGEQVRPRSVLAVIHALKEDLQVKNVKDSRWRQNQPVEGFQMIRLKRLSDLFDGNWRSFGQSYLLWLDLESYLQKQFANADVRAWVYHKTDVSNGALPGFYLGWRNGQDKAETLARSKSILKHAQAWLDRKAGEAQQILDGNRQARERRSEAREKNPKIISLERKIARLEAAAQKLEPVADVDPQAKTRLLVDIPSRVKRLQGTLKKLQSARSEARTDARIPGLLAQIRILQEAMGNLIVSAYTDQPELLPGGTSQREQAKASLASFEQQIQKLEAQVKELRSGQTRSEVREGILPRVNPSRSWEWMTLKIFAPFVKRMNIAKAYEKDPTRRENFSVDLGDFYFDGSKNLITKQVLNLLVKLAGKTGLRKSIDLMFAGAPINETEKRPVFHSALRNIKKDEATGEWISAGPMIVNGKDVMPDVLKVLNKMAQFVREIHSGARKGYTGKQFKNVVVEGIGGSYLGPEMAVLALEASRVTGMKFYFVANVDGADVASKVTGQMPGVPQELDPEETLVLVLSKTYTTQETIMNAVTTKNWLLKHYQGDERAVASHFMAVSTAEELVKAFGIDTANMFEFWDWVGGRYSMWSAIGLPIMLAIGPENFFQMLAGAHEMDVHFRTAPFAKNIPVLKALLDIWNRIFLKMTVFIVAPYSQLLSRLGAYLQQLFMESNGKSIDRNGKRVTYSTSSSVFGEAMTNGQHAYQQQPHQGDVIPEDFIGFINPSHTVPGHHQVLLSNLLGQTEALAVGKSTTQVLAELKADQAKNPKKYENWTEEDFLWLARHKTFEGSKPTNLILIDELTPYMLGKLIAMYEHQVAAEGFILNIFSFDQWGVELGKVLAKMILPLLQGVKEIATAGLTASTAFAVQRVLERQKPAKVSPTTPVVQSETPATPAIPQDQGEASRSEVREAVIGDLNISIGQISLERNPTLEAALITAEKVTARILSIATAAKVFAAGVATGIAQKLFPEHFSTVPAIPAAFSKWTIFKTILSHSARASKERLLVDLRHGVPDVASVLPLVAFARYNPRAQVTLALIAHVDDVKAFEKALAVGAGDVLGKNFKVNAVSNASDFNVQFTAFYNDAAPRGTAVALVMDQEDPAVQAKIGGRKYLLSVIGDATSPLKQTASALLAADKLLGSLEGMIPFIAIAMLDREGRLGELMANLTSFIAAQKAMGASA